MRELIRTNDPVLLNLVEYLLGEAGIAVVILDSNMSVLEGSLGMLPRRVMVAEDHEIYARQLLCEADLGAWLIDEKPR
jgi:Putative prokaryotic signal transducing protein